jgi:hypothetical protein
MSSVSVLCDMKDDLIVAEFVVLCWRDAENYYSGDSGVCNHLKLSPKPG